MQKKLHNLNIAFCVGDLPAAKPMLYGLCNGLDKYSINLHIFQGFTSDYDGEPQDLGQTNIYNLPNYNYMDMLIVAPFYLSTNNDIINSVIDRAKSAGVPIITIGKKYDGCFCVMSDYTSDIEKVTNHIIRDHHCTDLVFMSGIKGDYVSELRTQGFINALKANGLEFDSSSVFYGGFWDDPAIEALNQIIECKKPLPQAIICANDTMASVVIRKLTELGYEIPNDIIVTGMDGIEEANGYITTARIFSEKTGEVAADVAAQILLEGKEPTDTVIIPPVIELGASCGCRPDTVGISSQKRHELFQERYNSRKYAKSTLKLTQELSNCTTYDQAIESLSTVISKIWTESCWLCVCDDFFEEIKTDKIDSADELANSTDCGTVHITDYSKNMRCLTSYRKNTRLGQCTFKTEEMLPDFLSVADESRVILYSPLHYRDNTIGYLAFEFFPWSTTLHVLNILTIGISSTLEAVRRQNELLIYAKKVDELYVTDALTGLYNRRGFFRLYNDYLESDNKTDCMVISVDLDNLKQINDNFGHKEGDNAISTMADALKSAANEGDVCARFGGDEYLVFGRCESEEYLRNYKKRIKSYLERYNMNSNKPYNVHASFGGCIIPAHSNDQIDYYINQADSKMYADKEKHKRKRGLNPKQ